MRLSSGDPAQGFFHHLSRPHAAAGPLGPAAGIRGTLRPPRARLADRRVLPPLLPASGAPTAITAPWEISPRVRPPLEPTTLRCRESRTLWGHPESVYGPLEAWLANRRVLPPPLPASETTRATAAPYADGTNTQRHRRAHLHTHAHALKKKNGTLQSKFPPNAPNNHTPAP